MSANMFDILMVIALGALAGTGIGLLIGFFAKKQKGEWSVMTRKDQTLNIALVIVFCVICITGLAYYFLD
jgi:NADH:ubiquinone oxidoreductase subunit 5 (subunit L)/multisubunit Na+/H+ antiporter MnhA subunit